jgi:protease-4
MSFKPLRSSLGSISALALVTASTVAISFASVAHAAAYKADNKVTYVTLDGPILEQASPMASMFGGKKELTLRGLLEAIDQAKDDSESKGLVIRIKDTELPMTLVEELGAKLKDFRASGKKVHIFAEGYSSSELALGSYADEVIVQKGGAIELPGMYMEEMFLADTLAWAGLKADMVQVGAYKGASEQMMNAKPSPEWDQNINQLLDSMYGNLRSHIKSGRKLDDAKLDKAMEVAWMSEAKDAISSGLIDSAIDLPSITDALAKGYGGTVELDESSLHAEAPAADVSNPFAIFSMLSKPVNRTPTRDTIAILHIKGTIIDGDSQSGGFGGGDGSVGSRTIRNAIEELRDDDHIKGVVVRIDSPGGSAIASEVMWLGLRSLAEKKPVWASVGSMAASGGYYVAVGTDKIYVNPSSIVGSIGVVGGKIAMGGLLEKAHVNVVPRARGPRAAMFSTLKPWTDAERDLVRTKMTETYTLFTSRVSAGRKGIDLEKTAAGRLFTGDKAINLKMADAIGGIEVAITDLAKSVNISEYDVFDYPAPKTFAEAIEESIGRFLVAPKVAASQTVKEAVADGIWSVPEEIVGVHAAGQIRDGMRRMMMLRKEPVLVVNPSIFIFKR